MATIDLEYGFGEFHPLTLGAAGLGVSIIQAWRYKAGHWIVLAHRSNDAMHPFVVWVATAGHSIPQAAFHWGDYCRTLPEALEAFQGKASRHGGARD